MPLKSVGAASSAHPTGRAAVSGGAVTQQMRPAELFDAKDVLFLRTRCGRGEDFFADCTDSIVSQLIHSLPTDGAVEGDPNFPHLLSEVDIWQ
jgi:hypothetical protein